ncbi:MAG: hypothetical protein AAGK23_11765 [Pseudomonadota bacterium]
MNSDFTETSASLSATDLNPMLSFQPFELRNDVDSKFFLESVWTNLDTLVLRDSRNGALKMGTDEKEFFPVKETLISGWTVVGAAWSVRRTVTWLTDAPLDTPSQPNVAQTEEVTDPKQQEAIEKAKVAWKRHESLSDRFQQVTWNLLLIGLRNTTDGQGEAALHCTDSGVRKTVADFLLRGQIGDLYQQKPLVRRLPGKILETVCLDGNARQAALAGIHREINTKANTKAMAGPKLQDAFDPFDDQTFRLESAVSVSGSREPAFLGVALRNQQVWSKRGKTLRDFAGQLGAFFDTVRETQARPLSIDTGGLNQAGYKSLATAIDEDAINELAQAMDVDFRPQMDLADNEDDSDELKYVRELERQWFEDGAVLFESGAPDNASVTYLVIKQGRNLLRQTVTPRSVDGEISIEVEKTETLVDEEDPDLELFESLCENGRLGSRLAIWYDTSHVLVDRRLSKLKYTDVLFDDGWKWLPYRHGHSEYDVTAEKPTKPNSKGTGKTAALEKIGDQDSIFCYLLKIGPKLIGVNQPIWTICDDGSNEIADFIYFAPQSRKLWLVHAKGAHVSFSAEEKLNHDLRRRKLANRGLSVSAYEQVVGQATKNIRFLDPAILADGLEERKTRHLWWNGARPANVDKARGQIIQQLRSTPILLERVLAVAQPHILEDVWVDAKNKVAHDPDSSASATKTYKLLSALLADLQITSQKVGAKFYVLGHRISAPLG